MNFNRFLMVFQYVFNRFLSAFHRFPMDITMVSPRFRWLFAPFSMSIARETCIIAVNLTSAEPLHVESFATEDGYDSLLVNCKAYSGQRSPEGVVPDSP